MKNKLKIAAIAAIISIILIPPEIFLEHKLDQNPGAQWIYPLMILIYIITVTCGVFFYYGFYAIAKILDIREIKIGVCAIVMLHFVWYTFQVFALGNTISFYNIFGAVVLVVFGISRIIFGFGIFKARGTLGKSATAIAYLEIVTGLFLISVYIYFVGLFTSLIAAVLQILLLLRLHKTNFTEQT